jgi:Flp pilus assembly protein TadD
VNGPPASVPRERVFAAAFLVVLAGIAVYAPTLNHGFVYDDYAVAGDNLFVRDLANLPRLFSGAYFRLADENTYRPLTTLTYFLDYAVWGAEPFGFNFTGMLVHLAGTVLVLLLALRLLGGLLPALAAALVFVLHPLATEAVISEGNREEALSVPFFVGALLLYLRAAGGGPRARAALAASAIVYALGLFAMEMTITLPAILVVLEIATRGDGAIDRRMVGRRLAPFALIAASFLVGRFTVWTGTGDYTTFPGGSRVTALLTAARVYVDYARLLVLPTGQHVVYDVPLARTLDGRTAAAITLMLTGIGAGAFLAWRRRLAGVVLLWFAVVLLPVSNVVIPFWVLESERYLYLVLPANALAVGLLVRRGGAIPAALVGIAIVGYGVAATYRAEAWESSATLWADNVKQAPDASDARYNLGIDRLRRGDDKGALREFVEAAASDHRDAVKPLAAIAGIHRRAGRSDEALAAIDRALAADPDYAPAAIEKGYVYVDRRDFAQAARWFAHAAALDPRDATARSSLAGALLSLKRYDEAVRAAGDALARDPRDARALQVLAHVAAVSGRRSEAVRLYADVYRFATDPAIAASAIANLRRLGAGDR